MKTKLVEMSICAFCNEHTAIIDCSGHTPLVIRKCHGEIFDTLPPGQKCADFQERPRINGSRAIHIEGYIYATWQLGITPGNPPISIR